MVPRLKGANTGLRNGAKMKELIVIRDAVRGVVKQHPSQAEVHLGFDVMFAGLKDPAITTTYSKLDQGRSTKHHLSFMSGDVTLSFTFIENGKVFMTLPGKLKVGEDEYGFQANHSAVVFEDKARVESPLVREIITAVKHFI